MVMTSISSRGGGSSAAWQTTDATPDAAPATSAVSQLGEAASSPIRTARNNPTPSAAAARARYRYGAC